MPVPGNALKELVVFMVLVVVKKPSHDLDKRAATRQNAGDMSSQRRLEAEWRWEKGERRREKGFLSDSPLSHLSSPFYPGLRAFWRL